MKLAPNCQSLPFLFRSPNPHSKNGQVQALILVHLTFSHQVKSIWHKVLKRSNTPVKFWVLVLTRQFASRHSCRDKYVGIDSPGPLDFAPGSNLVVRWKVRGRDYVVGDSNHHLKDWRIKRDENRDGVLVSQFRHLHYPVHSMIKYHLVRVMNWADRVRHQMQVKHYLKPGLNILSFLQNSR